MVRHDSARDKADNQAYSRSAAKMPPGSTARMAVLQFSRDLALDLLQGGLRGLKF